MGSMPNGVFLKKTINKANGANLFTHGINAFDDIKGLKTQYIKGVILTLFLAFVLYYVQHVYLYGPFIAEFLEHYADKINGWWSWLSYITTPILWILKVFCWAIMMLIAFKLAIVCMGFWIDTIIEKVIHHHREMPDLKFSMARFVRSTSRGVILTSKNLIFSIIFLILGFIPVLGVAFGFVGVACSNGFDIVSPYVLIITEQDESVIKDFSMDKIQTFKVGWIQAVLTYIPIVGWVFIPFIMLLQVIGYAHFIETEWQKESASAA